jgi:hypothetical protein
VHDGITMLRTTVAHPFRTDAPRPRAIADGLLPDRQLPLLLLPPPPPPPRARRQCLPCPSKGLHPQQRGGLVIIRPMRCLLLMLLLRRRLLRRLRRLRPLLPLLQAHCSQRGLLRRVDLALVVLRCRRQPRSLPPLGALDPAGRLPPGLWLQAWLLGLRRCARRGRRASVPAPQPLLEVHMHA